jgi:hypothetical protein
MPFQTNPKIKHPHFKLIFLHQKRRQQPWPITKSQSRKTGVSHILNIINLKAMNFVMYYDILRRHVSFLNVGFSSIKSSYIQLMHGAINLPGGLQRAICSWIQTKYVSWLLKNILLSQMTELSLRVCQMNYDNNWPLWGLGWYYQKEKEKNLVFLIANLTQNKHLTFFVFNLS